MGETEDLKQQIRKEASDRPERFFPVDKLNERGFRRDSCKECGRFFWTKDDEREVCGEAECSGGYSFIGNSPTEKELDYTSAWTEFRDFMEERGYTGIKRYPVLARWREDTEFVRASIYDFQPYVVSGEVEPPANPLVIPQFCLRFNDIDNVGVTGSHYTGFIMTGQHAFVPEEEYNQDKYFEDMLDWLVKGLGIEDEKVVLHEDAWAGGGNLGGCMEFFVDGMEILNQVYMTYEIDGDGGYREIETKVLDMGMGHERTVWLAHGTQTSYEANMPGAVKKLYKRTGVEPDEEIWKKFLPYSGLLNTDEVDDMDVRWSEIAAEVGVSKEKLKEEVKPAAALYSIADHTRTLLVALVDGALPSNTGEKHSLRVIARRALDFIDKYGWDLELEEVMEWHSEEMKELFPELKENLEQAKRIIRHEERKYGEMMEKAGDIIEGLGKEEIDERKLVELYDTHGISPEFIKRSGLDIEVPQNFYSMVSERHSEETPDKEEEVRFDLGGLPKTEELYYDERKRDFEAEVLKILEKDGEKYVVLDQTCFYPTQGGQMSDVGTINGREVLEAVNEGGTILHRMGSVNFSEGETVKGEVDWSRRKQLMQHHTATHVINGAAAEVLGNHVSQAGAKKTEEKARLDITHYRNLTREELEGIERVALEWIRQGLKVDKTVMKRSEAEKKYGFKIYQGGVPPGNKLRIVNIGEGKDVEACGGTHVDNTSEIEELVLVNSTKVQDGVVRLEFKSGEAAKDYKESRKDIIEELDKTIDMKGYSLEDLENIFDVSTEELIDVVGRFAREWDERKNKLEDMKDELDKEEPVYGERPVDPQRLFEEWKELEKNIRNLEVDLCDKVVEEVLESDEQLVKKEVPVENMGNLIRAVKRIVSEDVEKTVVLRGEKAVVGSRGSESKIDVKETVGQEAEVVKEEEGLVKGFKLK